jgi:hypothetical protein
MHLVGLYENPIVEKVARISKDSPAKLLLSSQTQCLQTKQKKRNIQQRTQYASSFTMT